MEVTDNTLMRHYEAEDGKGQLATIEYQKQEKKIFLMRVDFPEGFEGSGKADEMIERILDLIEQRNMRAVPMSKQLKLFFKTHPERKHLLPVGVHL